MDYAQGPLFAFRKVEDQDYLSFQIQKEGPWAVIYYSVKRRAVTGISLVFFPPEHNKSTETWVDARSITFEPDGSYRVHFSSGNTKP